MPKDNEIDRLHQSGSVKRKKQGDRYLKQLSMLERRRQAMLRVKIKEDIADFIDSV